MKVSGILGGLAVVAMLGGCTQVIIRPVPKGVGFTGVGFQSAGADTSYADGIFSNRQEVVPATQTTTTAVGSGGKARQAMRVSSITNAKQVTVNGELLFVSLQNVDGTRFAVAEKRKRIWGGHVMRRGTDKAFLAAVQSATGCAPVGGVWRWGQSPARPVKLAAEVTCS